MSTVVGYAGGTTDSPTYTRLGDHTEAFQVEYDPEVVSYEDLLGVFWLDHDPARNVAARQYRRAVFAHDGNQQKRAEASRERIASSLGVEVQTPVERLGAFYPAEDYHQKYYLRRHRDIAGEYAALYPREGDFLRSTAVARVNGFLGGNGTLEDLEEVTPSLGLSAKGARRLREYVETSSPRRACPLPARPRPRRALEEAVPGPARGR